MEKRKLALKIEETNDHSYYHIRCFVRTPCTDGWQGVHAGTCAGEALAHLAISCQGDDHRRERGTYAWSVGLREVYSQGLNEARAAVALLAKIEKSLEKQEQKSGRALSYGQYCLRVAVALGAMSFVLYSRADGWREMDLASGQAHIDRLIWTWQQPQQVAA